MIWCGGHGFIQFHQRFLSLHKDWLYPLIFIDHNRQKLMTDCCYRSLSPFHALSKPYDPLLFFSNIANPSSSSLNEPSQNRTHPQCIHIRGLTTHPLISTTPSPKKFLIQSIVVDDLSNCLDLRVDSSSSQSAFKIWLRRIMSPTQSSLQPNPVRWTCFHCSWI